MSQTTHYFKSEKGKLEKWQQLQLPFENNTIEQRNSFCYIVKPANKESETVEILNHSVKVFAPKHYTSLSSENIIENSCQHHIKDNDEQKNNAGQSYTPIADTGFVSKKYYKIGEVSNILKIPSSTIRFWQNNIYNLTNKKVKKGIRYFSQEDIYFLSYINNLVHKKKLTLQACNDFLKSNQSYIKELRSNISCLVKRKEQILEHI